ncbi:MAG TPA: hypothetical protein VD788_06430 [Candidatus Polarisedimenticolaceae bacterium]|nr:hypothetical protein [Candidatus Polarisedimenticolaceae bacterium]
MRVLFGIGLAVVFATGVALGESPDAGETGGARYCPSAPFSMQVLAIRVDGTHEEVFRGEFASIDELWRGSTWERRDLGLSFARVPNEPGCFTLEREIAEVDSTLTSIRSIYREGSSRITVDYDPSSASSITQVDDGADER